MFGDLTAAFGLTVLCLAPLMLVSLLGPLILMRVFRPKPKPDNAEPGSRNMVMAAVAFTRFYFITLVVAVTVTIVFWWGALLLTGTESVADFAAQSIPGAQSEAVEEAIQPAMTEEADG
jgi:hypothetical protein